MRWSQLAACPRWVGFSVISGEQWETCRRGQTTQKANMYLGDFWTSQPEQVVTFFFMNYHWEMSSEANISLRRSRYSSPHLAPRTASRQFMQRAGACPRARMCCICACGGQVRVLGAPWWRLAVQHYRCLQNKRPLQKHKLRLSTLNIFSFSWLIFVFFVCYLCML